MKQPTHIDDKFKAFVDNNRKKKAEKRIEEIEEILLELPFTDPNFQKLVQERNNLSINTK